MLRLTQAETVKEKTAEVATDLKAKTEEAAAAVTSETKDGAAAAKVSYSFYHTIPVLLNSLMT